MQPVPIEQQPSLLDIIEFATERNADRVSASCGPLGFREDPFARALPGFNPNPAPGKGSEDYGRARAVISAVTCGLQAQSTFSWTGTSAIFDLTGAEDGCDLVV